MQDLLGRSTIAVALDTYGHVAPLSTQQAAAQLGRRTRHLGKTTRYDAPAVDWVRKNFHPDREPPSDRNYALMVPAYVDRDLSGRGYVTASRSVKDGLVFVDWGKGGMPVD